MENPFKIQAYNDQADTELLQASLKGNRDALDELVRRHQPFIYNVAIKMVHNPEDAKDLTQEVLIRVITNLGKYQSKSSFRTWLYRIVVNHFLQMKRRPMEDFFSSYEDFASKLDEVPDSTISEAEKFEWEEYANEMKIRCMSGMLMCLTRDQRLVYVLGEIFKIDHQIGAEILNISPGNFRIKLYRARKDLVSFMNLKCGLVNKDNPCRCNKKAKTLAQMGMLDKNKFQFNIETTHRIKSFARQNIKLAEDTVEDKYAALYHEHPFREDMNPTDVIEHILGDEILNNLFGLN